MATQYEVEHDIRPSSAPRRRRQIDMSTFTAHLHNITPDIETSTSAPNHPPRDRHDHNPHAVPNPTDTAALFHLLQDQMVTLASTAPDDANRAFLESLVETLEPDVARPPRQIEGVSQAFLDALDRVPRRSLRADDACPICAERYLDDEYCLVVELPCHESHRFDLECVGPWLRAKGTCPLCRKEVGRRREVVVERGKEEDEEDGDHGLYA